MVAPNHLLHHKPGEQGYSTWRLECLPEGFHGSYIEGSWADETECRCTLATCACRTGDHGGCTTYGGYIENIGSECRCQEDMSYCWTVDWWDEQGMESLEGDDWPEDVLPLPVLCSFDGDCMRVSYCPAVVPNARLDVMPNPGEPTMNLLEDQ